MKPFKRLLFCMMGFNAFLSTMLVDFNMCIRSVEMGLNNGTESKHDNEGTALV